MWNIIRTDVGVETLFIRGGKEIQSLFFPEGGGKVEAAGRSFVMVGGDIMQ